MESTEKKNSYQPSHKKHGANNRRKKTDNTKDNGQFKKHKQPRDKQIDEKTVSQSPAPQEKNDNKKKPADKKNKQRQPHRRRDNFKDDQDIRMYHNDYTPHFDVDDVYEESYFTAEDNRKKSRDTENSGLVVGRNAVRELLKSNRAVDKLIVRRGDREGSIVVLVAEAISRGIPVVEAEKGKLDAMSGGAPHQGVIAMAAEKEYVSVDEILKIAKDRGEDPLIVIADGIVDPYNLGALIRCAEGAGAHGLIIPKRRAVGLTPIVSKASAGAVEHLAIAKVSNIASTIEDLKKKGVWTYAAEADGTAYYDTDFSGPAALVFGSEGDGIGENVKKKCDFIVSIPMYGHVNSLNVSTAASVLLCEAARKHRTKAKN